MTRAGHALTKNPKTINQAADNDCEDECPDKYVEPPASIQVATNDTEHNTSYAATDSSTRSSYVHLSGLIIGAAQTAKPSAVRSQRLCLHVLRNLLVAIRNGNRNRANWRSIRWSRGSDPRLLRLTLDRLPDHASGERPRGSEARPYPKAKLANSNVFVLRCHLD